MHLTCGVGRESTWLVSWNAFRAYNLSQIYLSAQTFTSSLIRFLSFSGCFSHLVPHAFIHDQSLTRIHTIILIPKQAHTLFFSSALLVLAPALALVLSFFLLEPCFTCGECAWNRLKFVGGNRFEAYCCRPLKTRRMLRKSLGPSHHLSCQPSPFATRALG